MSIGLRGFLVEGETRAVCNLVKYKERVEDTKRQQLDTLQLVHEKDAAGEINSMGKLPKPSLSNTSSTRSMRRRRNSGISL